MAILYFHSWTLHSSTYIHIVRWWVGWVCACAWRHHKRLITKPWQTTRARTRRVVGPKALHLSFDVYLMKLLVLMIFVYLSYKFINIIIIMFSFSKDSQVSKLTTKWPKSSSIKNIHLILKDGIKLKRSRELQDKAR